MEKGNPDKMNSLHYPPQPDWWQGRQTPADEKPAYWHQQIRCWEPDQEPISAAGQKSTDFVLLGYACDAGVYRNQGRPGAKGGPRAIRERLAKLALPADPPRILDLGDIRADHAQLENGQAVLGDLIDTVLKAGATPVVLGGGHDIAYGHYLGLRSFLSSQDKKRLGILNLDAHFDLREPDGQGNSGTPFYQILSDQAGRIPKVQYFALGIQAQANTQTLFATAEKFGVHYLPARACNRNHWSQVREKLDGFLRQIDHLYLSIDLDGFASAYAPGVSAPSPMGFAPSFVLSILDYLMDTGKLLSVDVAELNPDYDQDGATARLAASLVHHFLCGRQQS